MESLTWSLLVKSILTTQNNHYIGSLDYWLSETVSPSYNLPQLANERFAKYFWETFAPQNELILKDVCTEDNLRMAILVFLPLLV